MLSTLGSIASQGEKGWQGVIYNNLNILGLPITAVGGGKVYFDPYFYDGYKFFYNNETLINGSRRADIDVTSLKAKGSVLRLRTKSFVSGKNQNIRNVRVEYIDGTSQTLIISSHLNIIADYSIQGKFISKIGAVTRSLNYDSEMVGISYIEVL